MSNESPTTGPNIPKEKPGRWSDWRKPEAIASVVTVLWTILWTISLFFLFDLHDKEVSSKLNELNVQEKQLEITRMTKGQIDFNADTSINRVGNSVVTDEETFDVLLMYTITNTGPNPLDIITNTVQVFYRPTVELGSQRAILIPDVEPDNQKLWDQLTKIDYTGGNGGTTGSIGVNDPSSWQVRLLVRGKRQDFVGFRIVFYYNTADGVVPAAFWSVSTLTPK